MRRLTVVACVTLVAGLFAAACSSGSASPTPEPKPTTSTPKPTTTATLTTTTLSPPDAGFCGVVVKYEQKLVADFLSLLLPNPEPGVAEKTVAEIRAIVDELHSSAPPEISESADALAAEAKVLLDALVAAGYDVTKIREQLASSKAIPAANEVLTFARTRCGIKTTIPTSP